MVREAENTREAMLFASVDCSAVVLLDLGLPDRDGLELVPLLKAKGAAVITVPARDATAEKVFALDLGADDYVTKPFDKGDLLARIPQCGSACKREPVSGVIGVQKGTRFPIV